MAEIDQAYIERIEAGFARIDSSLRDLGERLRQSEMREAGFATPTAGRVDAAWRKIDEQAAILTELQRDLAQLTASVAALQNILRWMLGIVTSLLVAVLIALATGHLALEILP